MKKNYFFTLLFICFSIFVSNAQNPVINEVDADTPGTDTMEFIEIKWTPNTSLDGYVVVLFNGSNDTSYDAYDLDGFSTDANGFFILGNSGIANVDIDMGASNKIQNGADAVAIYQASDTDFPNGTSPTTTNLIDALVYDTNDSDDSGLLSGFGLSIQYNEDENGNKDNESIQRHSDGTYQILATSLRAENATSSSPSLSIASPSDNAELNPETSSVDVEISVANFTVASGGTGDGYITYTVNGGAAVDKFDTNNISLSSLTAGSTYEVVVELVDNSGNSLSPAVSATVNFSIGTYTVVTDLAALRAGTEGDYYEISGEVIYTFEGTSRNQKFIQDASAAVLIDDNSGIITTSYSIGDGLTGLRGRLGSFNGVTQFVPAVDPGAATSSGNQIPMQTVTIAQLNANLNDYESEFVTVNSVDFTDGDGSATFSSGSNYDITDGSETMVFRVHFSGTDIAGSVIPTVSADITGIAGEFNGTAQIFGINLANIVLGIQRNDIEGFATYPNPVTNNEFTVTTSSSDAKQVAIYNVIGKQVFSSNFTGTRSTINIASLAKGLYILKVTEGTKVATSKLIIK